MIISSRLTRSIIPYVAGEQPQDMKYLKINTNENPYGPSKKVLDVIEKFDLSRLRLYPDPKNTILINAIKNKFGVNEENVFVGNGSDEVLGMCFQAFFDPEDLPVAFPDVTYSFYKVWAKNFNINTLVIPLDEDFKINVDDYTCLGNSIKGIILANPNAPTSIELAESKLLEILNANRDKIVIVDEAYADFADFSMVPYIKEYDNLLVVRTFSKSYSLAGARCGYAIGNENLINALNIIKNSFNSYTVNMLTESLATAALEDDDYFKECIDKVIEERERVSEIMRTMGFEVLESRANFIFARHKTISGNELYFNLKQNGVLVRHFNQDRIVDFIRITIGTQEQMEKFIETLKKLISLYLD